jgi:hypothetical protein
MNNEVFVIAEQNERFVSEFWGQSFSLETASVYAQDFSNRVNRCVYIWDTSSIEANKQPVKKIVPYPVQTGYYFQLWVNHDYREAQILAISGRDTLVEYVMPEGTTGLRIIPVDKFTGEKRQKLVHYAPSIAYTRVGRKWLEAIEEGYDWRGNPQMRGKQRIQLSARDMLRKLNDRE